jgi:ketosteroid isomerase-like protein
MAKRDIKTLEGAYVAFGKGDIDTALAAMDSRISWSEPLTLPWGAGRHSGPKAVATKVFAEALRLIPDLKVKTESFESAGDTVLVRGTFTGSGKGGKFKAPFAHVWTMRNGKAVKMQNYTDTSAINAAIGGSGRRGIPRSGP